MGCCRWAWPPLAYSACSARRSADLSSSSGTPPLDASLLWPLSAPAALVLGAQVHPDGTPSAFLSARLDLATQLYRAGKVKLILVSGASTAPEYDEPQAMRSYLIDAGIPESQVIIDNAGIDTYSSCVRAREIFGVSDLIVVTQSYHLPRAVATCLRVGVNAYGVGDDSARQYTRSWRSGAVRDQLACVKTVLDLTFDRRPDPAP